MSKSTLTGKTKLLFIPATFLNYGKVLAKYTEDNVTEELPYHRLIFTKKIFNTFI
jgi:hypothetical protein